MSDFNVGPGVQAALAENNDSARSDEQFIILREGQKVSMTFGSSGVYYWYESENAVKRCPF